MHGRLKVKTTEEKIKEKLIEQQKKLKKFQIVCSDVLQSRRDELGLPLLNKTAEVLITNPDLYTFWNIRKEILLKIKQDSVTAGEDLFKRELHFLDDCLKSNPKSYGSWQHRCFVMDSMENPDWKNELDLCSKFLEIDDRNFHCWDYRRFVVKRSHEPLDSELSFTTRKIEADFSNFSSWHYRSKILTELVLASENWESTLISELLLVENAIFTDPSDQSGWFYHRWLLNKNKGISPDGVFVDRENMKILVLLSSPLRIGDLTIDVFMNEEYKKLKWETANHRKFCRLMIAHLNSEHYEAMWNGAFELKVEISSSSFANDKLFCKFDSDIPCQYFSFVDNRDVSSLTQPTLEKQYDSLKELHSLEPDNKWTFHALILIMKHLDSTNYYSKALEYLNELTSLDQYRCQFYSDFVSRLKMESKSKNLDECARSIDLSNMFLTQTSSLEKLCSVKCVNLSNNNLTSLDEAYFLQCVEVLILHHNQFSNCSDIKHLQELKIIDLSHNDIKCIEDLLPLKTCPKLETLLLNGNPVTHVTNYRDDIKNHLPIIKNLN